MSGLGLWIQGQLREKWRGPWSLNNQWNDEPPEEQTPKATPKGP